MSKIEEKKEDRVGQEQVEEVKDETSSGAPEMKEPEEGGGALSFWEILEERIVQLVRRIAALQEENAHLKKELVEREADLKAREEECERLRALKAQMREKVERLIVKIEEYQEMAEKNELPKPPKE